MKKVKLILLLSFLINTSLIAQWVPSGGPNGAELNQIVTTENSVIVSGGNSGVFKSSDNGESWIQINNGLPLNTSVFDLTQQNGFLYASISGNGLYKSIDEGETWTPINSGISNLTFYDIGVFGTNIYAGNANGGLYYSPDNGETWSDISGSEAIANTYFQSFTSFNSEVYAGGSTLFKTSDNGENWEEVTVNDLGPNGISSMVSTDATIFLGSDGNIFTSTDGINWSKNPDINTGSIISMGVSGDSVFFTSSSGIFYLTTDEGLNWNQIQNTETFSLANDVALINGRILMSTYEGIYSSDNGGQDWIEKNDGISALQIISLQSTTSNLFAGTERQGIFRSDFLGSWSKINNGLTASNALTIQEIIIIDDQVIIGTGGGVYSSLDNGDSWTRRFDPGQNIAVHALAFDNGRLVCGVNNGDLFISTDTATSWTAANRDGLDTESSIENILIKGDTIVVATGNGEMFISENFSSTWSDISIVENYTLTNDLQFVDGRLLAGTSRGLFGSDDLGENWVLITEEPRQIKSFVINENKIFAATYDGVYVTSENRTKWQGVNDELGNQDVNAIKLIGDKIYVGTFANSVWERISSETNLYPIVSGEANEIQVEEDNSFSIELSDLIVDDVDSEFPGEFTITILDGNRYTFENNEITPDQDFNGNLSVNLIVNDGMDDSPVYEFIVEVTPVNDPPIIIDQANTLSTAKNTSLTIELEDLTVEDVDNDYPSDFTLAIMEGENYTIENTSITPAQDYLGQIQVGVMVNDGELNSQEFSVLIEVTEMLGLNNNFIKENFTVYPNPVKDRLNIRPGNLSDSFQVSIYTMQGKLIYTSKTTISEIEINEINSLVNGIYFLEISSEGKSGRLKLVKE